MKTTIHHPHDHSSKKLVLLVLCAATICAAAVGQGPDVSEPSSRDDRRVVRECAKVGPDAEYFIPENLVSHTVRSGSGAYGYRKICPFWVVDFSLNSKSNSNLQPDGTRDFDDTVFYGIPHDLPSSLMAGGIDPIVKEDCSRLRVEHYIYKKFKHEAEFVFQKHLYRQGQWDTSLNHCTLTKNPAVAPDRFKTAAPQANVLVIRVATRVKLRTSWQEAAAKIEDLPDR